MAGIAEVMTRINHNSSLEVTIVTVCSPGWKKTLAIWNLAEAEQASREIKASGGRVVVQRRYKLFSDVQRADDIEVNDPSAGGRKTYFDYMEPVQRRPW